MAGDSKRPVDAVTGTETTGHEWDGIRELNTPLPRWWLWLFYLTIVWAIGYWIAYPAWPLLTSNTQGVLDWNSRSAVAIDLAALRAQRARDDRPARSRFARSDSRRSRSCWTSRAPRAAPPLPTIARRVTAPAAAAPRAIRI